MIGKVEESGRKWKKERGRERKRERKRKRERGKCKAFLSLVPNSSLALGHPQQQKEKKKISQRSKEYFEILSFRMSLFIEQDIFGLILVFDT